jgi:hypothetical protein
VLIALLTDEKHALGGLAALGACSALLPLAICIGPEEPTAVAAGGVIVSYQPGPST